MVKANEIMLQHRIYDKPNLRMTVEAMLYRRAHQHNSGAAGGDAQAIGKSVGGNTTKIHMAADIDWCLYKYRHLVENVFARLKHFRAIATRYDKLKLNYVSMLAMIYSYICWSIMRFMQPMLKLLDVKNGSKIGADSG